MWGGKIPFFICVCELSYFTRLSWFGVFVFSQMYLHYLECCFLKGSVLICQHLSDKHDFPSIKTLVVHVVPHFPKPHVIMSFSKSAEHGFYCVNDRLFFFIATILCDGSWDIWFYCSFCLRLWVASQVSLLTCWIKCVGFVDI